MGLELIIGLLFPLFGQDARPATATDGQTQDALARSTDGHSIVPPHKIKGKSPKWPEAALRAGLTGAVVVEAVIGVDGQVESVKVLQGYRSLGEAATAAVKQWRYTTTRLDGIPVPAIMTVTVNFKLRKPPKRGEVMSSLQDSDPEIRSSAAHWLGSIRPVKVDQRAALNAALSDPSELVRTAATEALAKIEGR